MNKTIKITPLKRMFPKKKAEEKLLDLQRKRRRQIGKIAKAESEIAFLIYESKSITTEIAHTENVGDWKTRDGLMKKTRESTKRLADAIEKSSDATQKLDEINELYYQAADNFRETLTSKQLENVFPGLDKN